MNKEELKNKIRGSMEYFIDWKDVTKDEYQQLDVFLDNEIMSFEKKIQQDFLREVLPEELSGEQDISFEEGFNSCRQEFINRAKEKGIEIG